MINNYNSYKKDFLLLVDNIWLVSDGSQTILVIKKKKKEYNTGPYPLWIRTSIPGIGLYLIKRYQTQMRTL